MYTEYSGLHIMWLDVNKITFNKHVNFLELQLICIMLQVQSLKVPVPDVVIIFFNKSVYHSINIDMGCTQRNKYLESFCC